LNVYPYGTIALPCGEHGRYNRFAYSLANLIKPDGCTLAMVNGISIPRSLNLIIRDLQGDWIWFQADDHVFNPDLLIRMLDRDVDVLVPLIIRHGPPFAPVVFKSQNELGQYQPFAYNEFPEEGIFEVFAAGTGGMLVRREVLDAIGDPWFTFGQSGEVPNEDLEFCRKIREAGYTIYADSENLMGHMGIFTIWPERVEGEWGFRFDMGRGAEGAMNEIHVNVEKVREPVLAA
jgi:hypothetical protein